MFLVVVLPHPTIVSHHTYRWKCKHKNTSNRDTLVSTGIPPQIAKGSSRLEPRSRFSGQTCKKLSGSSPKRTGVFQGLIYCVGGSCTRRARNVRGKPHLILLVLDSTDPFTHQVFDYLSFQVIWARNGDAVFMGLNVKFYLTSTLSRQCIPPVTYHKYIHENICEHRTVELMAVYKTIGLQWLRFKTVPPIVYVVVSISRINL